MIFSAITEIGKMVVGGVTDHFQNKQKIKKAKVNAQIKRLESAQEHDQKWEIKSLDQAGWKDDVLFYAFIAMFVWAGFDPEGSKQFFENINHLPDWFIKTWFWLVASILGIKKIGDYAPRAIKEIKDVVKGK